MSKKIIFIFCILLVNSLLSQQTYSSLSKVELGGQGIELGYSHLISNSTFIDVSGGVGAGYNADDGLAEYVFSLGKPIPFLKTSINYFYNKEKRLAKGKSIKNNSGNFLGFQMKYSFGNNDDIDFNKSLLTEFHWGIHRTLGGNFFFDSHIGIGYLHDYTVRNGSITPTIGISFGYSFIK